MAKKSAKSKGYIRTKAKKPYLSKKEAIILAVSLGVILIALIAALIPKSDGSMKTKGGKLDVSEDSLILNAGTGYNPRYYKLGEIGEIEGYTRTAEAMDENGNVRKFIYTPAAESPIDSITVRTLALDAKTYAANSEESYTLDPDMVCDGLMDTQDDGHAVQYLTFRHVPSNNPPQYSLDEYIAEEMLNQDGEEIAEPEPVLVQALHGYVDAGENRMIYILIRNDVETIEEYVDDAIFSDALNQVLSAISYQEE